MEGFGEEGKWDTGVNCIIILEIIECFFTEYVAQYDVQTYVAMCSFLYFVFYVLFHVESHAAIEKTKKLQL